jgi:hypothetical protein
MFLSWTWQGQTADPGKEVALDEEFTIKIGQQIEVKDANLRITFTAVEEDSRCPVEILCVWAGNAKLQLEVKRSKKKFITVEMNTTLEPKERDYKGYRVKLVSLNPQRRAGIPVDPADYEATLVVSSK